MTPRSRLLRAAVALLLGAALVSSAAACSADGDAGSTTQTLAVRDFGDRVATPGVVTLDVRTAEEFASGHLPGAINIDVESSDFVDRVAELDRQTPYAIYCRSGNRSKVAMDLMAGQGFTDLAHLDGGIVDWTASGRPVVG